MKKHMNKRPEVKKDLHFQPHSVMYEKETEKICVRIQMKRQSGSITAC